MTLSAYSWAIRANSFQWVLGLPYFALVVGTLARLLTFLIPRSILCGLVKLVTSFPGEAAETTTEFLKSPIGVRQAL